MKGGIIRAALDGTGNQTIVPNASVYDLDIDFTSKEILWVDSATGHIFSSDYSGNNQTLVCALNMSSDHKRSIEMLSGSIYVLDTPASSGPGPQPDPMVGIVDRTTCGWVTGPNVKHLKADLIVFDSSAQPKGRSWRLGALQCYHGHDMFSTP